MKLSLAAVVFLGIVLCLALAVQAGADMRGAVTLTLILAFGALAFGVIRKSGGGGVGPVTCPVCAGLNSSNAPYCKHCGDHFED